ncbi:hypothetical protein M409DRAFT_55445 [Zasmidium cellare ATCC 36951]|uniref:Uncharacterized protein n=1 Tax=Zasmidium cellare ATCC 36951 TaxID=1080233 RepID=A0A6A6CHH5_ZASCE|nr:uncharacterized protein M409DRAFT_55445 [Zasmidium cellare ATCC 36951]KAF2166103.1 hypothetical protein M409DRAFT_55445 [Zasmidium cellare ATCC 36951]
MAASRPVVLDVQSIHDFIQYVLDNHAVPSTLVVCSTKATFLEALQGEPQSSQDEQHAINPRRLWQTPTLRLLSTSRTLKLAFCPDITHLRAYLATYTITVAKRSVEQDDALRLPSAQPIMAILNPIELHRPTSAFSAQGLNRTFSVATEAAHHTGSKLVMADIAKPHAISNLGEELQTAEARAPTSPWEEELPILNVTTKRLGELSVGRTVKIKSVAERWCFFEKMPSLDSI